MINLKEIPTFKLVEELKTREGVRNLEIEIEEMYRIQKVGFELNSKRELSNVGPAIILEVID